MAHKRSFPALTAICETANLDYRVELNALGWKVQWGSSAR